MAPRALNDEASQTLSASTGFGGSFTVAYPANRTAEDYLGGTKHRLMGQSFRMLYADQGEFSLAFGASNITVTMRTNISVPNGETVTLLLDRAEADGAPDDGAEALADPASMTAMQTIKVTLGAPIASDSDAAVASQAATAAGGLATGINGVLATGGVATFDVPRNVVAAWTNTAVLTVTGTDAYGNTIVESSGSGTSMTGKKAFKTVTGISVSADVTGLTVGTSKVLGLPVFLADVGDVLKEYENGAAPTAGTVVAGATATATATTGDVRGTYAPNSNPNGSLVFEVLIAVRSASYKGAAQYAG